jgi:hypothetical protein
MYVHNRSNKCGKKESLANGFVDRTQTVRAILVQCLVDGIPVASIYLPTYYSLDHVVRYIMNQGRVFEPTATHPGW